LKASPQKGFVLIATSVAVMILLGLAVFGIDLGRMYMIKSEMQAFADAAALSAALELDGSDAGLARARAAANRVATGPNAMRWDMGTRPVTEISLSFAKGDGSPDPKTWQAEPKASSDYRFVRVVASAEAPLIFLRAFEPLRPDASKVAASSVAVKTSEATRLVE
jgi:Flp pilus assembly protein TadG